MERDCILAFAQVCAAKHEEGDSGSEACGSESRAIGFLPSVLGFSATEVWAFESQARFAETGSVCGHQW